MKIRLLLQFILILISIQLFGQNSIIGTVESNGEKLFYANIMIFKVGTGESKQTFSDVNGKFVFSDVQPAKYLLTVDFLGYEKKRKKIEVTNNIDLNIIELKETTIELEGVEIKGSIIQAIQKGDTTVYQAEAFKTLPDADVKTLISKLPGVTIENGEIKIEDENINRVTVDGQDFFTNDPNVALQTLPAEIVDKIEIIDEQSEQSKFTGFDDGNTTKTINIVTKVNKRNGQFGKVYAGFGEDSRYQTGGNINFFMDKRRLAVIGMSNNINQQNFTNEDILGVMGSSNRRGRRGGGGGGRGENFSTANENGISQTHSGGMNFNDQWGENAKFSLSYFANYKDNEINEFIDRTYLTNEQDVYDENNELDNQNLNHRVRSRLDIDINEKSKLTFQPRFSWQENDNIEVADIFYKTVNDSTSSFNNYISNSKAYTLSNSLRYQYKLAKKGRTISVNIGQSYNPVNKDNELVYNQISDNITSFDEQSTQIDNYDNSFSGGLAFTEPIGDNGQLMLEIQQEYSKDNSNELTYDVTDGDLKTMVDGLSNVLTSKLSTQSAEIGYRHRINKSMLMLRTAVQYSKLESEIKLPETGSFNKNFFNVIPMLMLRHEFSEKSNIRIFLRSRVNTPTANQLSENINNTNPLQLSRGNNDLNQTTTHSLFSRYKTTNSNNGMVFFSYAGVQYAPNYIGQKVYTNGRNVTLYDELNLDKSAQLNILQNMENYYSVRAFATLGLPVKVIKSKLNILVSGTYNNIPGITDDISHFTKDMKLGLGFTLASNISENIDFTINTTSKFGSTTSEINSVSNSNYLNQNSSLRLDIILPYGFVWRNDITHQLYSGYGDLFDSNYLLANMSIGKKLFKNDRGEISISVFDLFNQNQTISRNTQSAYFESIESNVLDRYFMINFKYDVRNFGQVKEMDERQKMRGMMRRQMH